jgi:hypothetical protein
LAACTCSLKLELSYGLQSGVRLEALLAMKFVGRRR